MEPLKTSEIAHIGRSVVIKGELSGSEDLYVDGEVEGTIELQGNSLTVGPNGKLRANVNAKNVVIHGNLEGNVVASERAELMKSAVVAGDIVAQKIAIEDGAYFKGKVDIQREPPQSASHLPASSATQSGGNGSPRSAAPAPPAAGASPTTPADPAPTGQTPVTGPKKF